MTSKRRTRQISELADQVLASVEDGHLSKTAGLAYTNVEMKTDTGRGLAKLAALVRDEASKPISYDDLARLRKNYGI